MMKRDDFGMRMDEIRELATKYSKPDLARMVQMGMLDPQRALMAGMMIDRIAKSAMQPPTTTVAEDVLSPQPPTTAQGQMPPGIMAAPGAPAPSEGVAALPSGMREMAGGGIVAFADGGDIDEYADGGAVRFADRGYVKSEWQIPAGVQAKRDEERQRILIQELEDARARVARGDPRAQGDVEALTRELRRAIPKPSADAGITSLLPSAQAAEPRIVEDPLQQRGEGGVRTIPPVIAGPKAANPPVSAEPQIKAPPAPPPAKPEFKVTEAPPAPAPVAVKEETVERPKAPDLTKLEVPAEPQFATEYDKVKQAYESAGINVNLYKEMQDELKTKKASFGEKRDRALGMALMSFGLGLAGAREGQVAQTLSQQGMRALAGYGDSMDRITDNEEKLDALDRQIRLADNQFKMTGADSAMRRVEKLQEQRTNIMAKNVEMANTAAQQQYQIGADLYRTDKTFQANMQAAAARIAIALGSNKGGFTDKQLVDLRAQMEIQYGPELRELNKDKGSKEQIEKIVAEELDKKVLEEVGKARNIRASGQIPVPSGGGGWNVSGGID
jgi:hypothetical protein